MDPALQQIIRRVDELVAASAAVMKAIDDPDAGPAAAAMQKGQLLLQWHAGCRAALEHLRTHPDVERLRAVLQDLAAALDAAGTSLDVLPPRAQAHPWTTVHANGNGNGGHR